MTAFRDAYERFLATHASPQVKRLMSASALLNLAISAISLFEPIYLYSLGWSLSKICFFYFGIYTLTFFLLPLGARLAGRIGLRHAILISTPFLIVYYLALYAIPLSTWFVVLAISAYAMQKALYWPGFDGEMARFGHDGERAREISNLASVSSFAMILGPTFGGVLLAAFGFSITFAVIGVLMLLSNIPLLSLPTERERASLPYLPALKRVFTKEHRRFALAMSGFGEEAIALVIWPIFLFTMLRDYATTGVVVSVSILLSTLALLFIGRLSDLQSRHAVLRTGAIFTAASWVIRPLLASSTGVLFGDFFHRVSRSLLSVPMVAIVYEHAGKGPLLERLSQYHMSVFFGKAVMFLVAGTLSFLLPATFLPFFILAAVASLLYTRLP